MNRKYIAFGLSIAIAGFACLSRGDEGGSGRWFRGNIHTHTRMSDGDLSPDEAAKLYMEHGYNFLCFTDHNKMQTNLAGIAASIPAEHREDFIVIQGEEIGGGVDVTAMNISRYVSNAGGYASNKTEVINRFSDAIRKAGGIPIIDHPNLSNITELMIRGATNCVLFELYNCYPTADNRGNSNKPSTEAVWDSLLTGGMRIYGVASDDTHHYSPWGGAGEGNPGKGWVMVHAKELTPTAICEALERGDFYSSIGVFLKRIQAAQDNYEIEVDEDATQKETALIKGVKPPSDPKLPEPGWKIEFIGPGGKVISSAAAARASCKRDSTQTCLRAKVTFTTEDADKKLVQFFAWTQPVFGKKR